MRIPNLLKWLGAGTLALAANACVIRETPVNYGYGYAQADYSAQGGVAVGEPSPYYVNDLPPEPLHETMSSSPGYGYAWIDGYWHWNGYEWVWVTGRWVQEQSGHIYVQPYYDWNDDGRYIYYPGYWSRPDRVPTRVKVVDHRDGRPSTGYHPPRNDRGQRPPSRDHRDDGGGHVRPSRDDDRPTRPTRQDPPSRQDNPPRDNDRPQRPTRDQRDDDRPTRRDPPPRQDNPTRDNDNGRPTRRDPPKQQDNPPRDNDNNDRPTRRDPPKQQDNPPRGNDRPTRKDPPPSGQQPTKRQDPPKRQDNPPSENRRPQREAPPAKSPTRRDRRGSMITAKDQALVASVDPALLTGSPTKLVQ